MRLKSVLILHLSNNSTDILLLFSLLSLVVLPSIVQQDPHPLLLLPLHLMVQEGVVVVEGHHLLVELGALLEVLVELEVQEELLEVLQVEWE